MPINFEEISGQVIPERGRDTAATAAAERTEQQQDPTEALRRELQIDRERQRRLVAD